MKATQQTGACYLPQGSLVLLRQAFVMRPSPKVMSEWG